MLLTLTITTEGKISDTGAKTLSDALKKNTSLTKIDLSCKREGHCDSKMIIVERHF